MANLEEVCEQLDRLAIAFFDTLNELEDTRKRYAMFCSEGYFGLTQARYAMGVGAVSPLQYDTTMTALARVSVREGEGRGEDVSRGGGEGSFSLYYHHSKHSGSQISNKMESLSIDSKEESGVRKRGPKPTAGVEEVEGENTKGRAEWETRSEEAVKDPLLWFGVLASHHLRTTQKSFIEGSRLCCQIAGLQTQLMALKEQYQVLLQSKKSLLKDISPSTESELNSKENEN